MTVNVQYTAYIVVSDAAGNDSSVWYAPPIKKGAGGGFFIEHRAQVVILDELTARILNAKAMATRQTPSELVTALVRRELAASA